MSLFGQRARVNEASLRVSAARIEMLAPTDALLARAERRPLTSVGIFAGAGFVLGQLNVHPLRIPGVGAMVGGSLVEMVSRGVHMLNGMDGGDSPEP